MSVKNMGLEVIPISKAVLHEETLPEKTKYLERIIQEQNFLKNPVIVTKAKRKYIVIDGNHRISALNTLSAKNVVVQVVRYSDVSIESWNRILKAPFEKIKKLFPMSRARKDELDCGVIYKNTVFEIEMEKVEVLRMLEQMKDELTIEYTTQKTTDAPLLFYRPFSKEEVISYALQGKLLPPKSTRHLIPYRVLGLRFPLEPLQTLSFNELEEILDEILRERYSKGSIREYEEKVIILDEYE
jgi:hypothetical protein